MSRGVGAALALCITYVFLGLLAPLIAPHDPVWETSLAQDAVPPAWAPLLLGDMDAPPRLTVSLTPPVAVSPPSALTGGGLSVVLRTTGPTLLAKSFNYDFRPPPSFSLLVFVNGSASPASRITIILVAPHGEYPLGEWDLAPRVSRRLYIDTRDIELARRLAIPPLKNAAETLMATRGTYQIQVRVEGETELAISGRLEVHPAAHGVLGTDYYGRDVWSQFIWGARYTLAYSFMVAVVAGLTGFAVGLLAGYRGGVADTLLVSVADIAQALPLVPLAFGVMLVAARNDPSIIAFMATAILWAPVARQVRARVMQERSKPYVDSARVIGLPDRAVMKNHILPNISSLLTYHLLLLVPTAVALEAALDILGFAGETTPTWGWMIYHAWLGGALRTGAWWWIGPPVMAIITLTLALVHIAMAVEERMPGRLI